MDKKIKKAIMIQNVIHMLNEGLSRRRIAILYDCTVALIDKIVENNTIKTYSIRENNSIVHSVQYLLNQGKTYREVASLLNLKEIHISFIANYFLERQYYQK